MTVRDTSLVAFDCLDLTAGQRRVLNWLGAQPPGAKFTRQEIADQSRIPLQSVCGRVNELLHDYQDPPLEELPAKDGAHPIRLKNKPPEGSHGDEAQREQYLRASEGREACGEDGTAVSRVAPAISLAPDLLSAAARGPKPEGNPAVGPAPPADPIGVTPVLQGRMSMTAARAKAIVEHPQARLIPEWCMAEAREVVERGMHWRTT